MKNILTLFIGALLLAGSAYAQDDATGTWDLNLTTPNGPMTVALTLKKDGEKLSGSIAGPQGEVAVQGTQKEKAVVVNFSVQTPNGPFAIVMTGNQDGDAIAGTMDFGGQGQAEWTGKRRAGAAAAAAPAAAGATTQGRQACRRQRGLGDSDRDRRQHRNADSDLQAGWRNSSLALTPRKWLVNSKLLVRLRATRSHLAFRRRLTATP